MSSLTTTHAPKGLEGVVATNSTICYIDGDHGVLAYRGIDIHDLADHSNFEETCYLLWFGRLPKRNELRELRERLAEERKLDASIINLLRIQHERQRKEYFPGVSEYIRLFGLTKERAKLLKPDCMIMHPGPINRGVEIDSEVADGNQSVILDQVINGLAVRMAVLYLCGGIATS